MSRYESWQDVLDDTCERLRVSGVLNKAFQPLADNMERVKFCLNETITQSRVDEWLKVLCCARHKKYWEKAFELRSEGNLCFGSQKYREAAEFYTKSILHAPFPINATGINAGHSEELSMSFANRSAAWFYLHKYNLCLTDISLSLQHDYPVHLKYKLFIREGQCYLKLGQYEKALEALDHAEHALELAEDLEAGKKQKQFREIELLKNKCNSKIPVDNDMVSSDEEEIEDNEVVNPSPHSSLPNTSSAVDCLYSTEKGRFIVANKEIKAGDNIFVESPYASVLLPNFAKSHCHHCYKRIRAAYPCKQCSQVRYCSLACADESWVKYHRIECGYLDLLHSVGIAHLAVRVIITTGLGLLEDFMKSRNTLECSYLNVYQLMTHEEDMHIEDMFQYSFTASLLLKFLERHSNYFTIEQLSERIQDLSLSRQSSGPRPPKAVIKSDCNHILKTYVGGLLLRHIQQLICNAHAITSVQNPEDDVIEEDGIIIEQEQVRVATAIYPSASLMNHSCNPNIISGFRQGSLLVVKAVRPIKNGEEVFNCYGPHYRRLPFQERQAALRDQYFFHCECPPCTKGDVEDQILMALKCEYCEGPLAQVAQSGKGDCIQCNTTQECLERQQKAFRMHDLFVQGVQLCDIQNYEEALEKLEKCLLTREKLLYRHNKQLMETRDMVAKVLCALHRFKDALDILKVSVESVRHVYGKHSIEYGNELLKYGDVLMNATQESFARTGFSRELGSIIAETKRVLHQTEPIFLLHYGKSHPAIKDVAKKTAKLDQFISRFSH